ncbi:MAG: hypothetical protein A2Y17_11605 [Clostridiales bacterium GWF2_38_85]|nr:MAG: hypothetical protein A2Y17_11605 [Clostridiales bacterium GWF2_38_85]HBL85347.1 1-acyl-sn-glycerol-3-phosphate acyltransferase [Clostridiales bacterium]
MTLYGFLCWVAKYLIIWIFPVKLVGNPMLPDGCIVCSNHISNWDPIFIACMLKSKIHVMGKAELFKLKIIGNFFKKINVFPVKRGANDIGAIKEAIRIIKEGNNLLLFPEGTRKSGKKPQIEDAKAGIGLIAANTGVDIVPILVYNKGYRVRIFHKTYVIIGEPIPKSEYIAYAGDNKHKISEYIFIKIIEVLDKFESKQ